MDGEKFAKIERHMKFHVSCQLSPYGMCKGENSQLRFVLSVQRIAKNGQESK